MAWSRMMTKWERKKEERIATFFLRGVEVGRSKFSSSLPQYNHAFVCPRTGECWGKILVERGEYWIPWRHSAPEQRPFMTGEIPGSYTMPWEEDLSTGMDVSILQYELTCALAQYEKEREN